MPLFYLLNTIATESVLAFVAVIFACNFVYNLSEKVVKTKLPLDKWLTAAKQSTLGMVLFLLSFVGVYLDASGKVLPWVGIGVIWLPLYVFSLMLLANVESEFKVSSNSRN